MNGHVVQWTDGSMIDELKYGSLIDEWIDEWTYCSLDR